MNYLFVLSFLTIVVWVSSNPLNYDETSDEDPKVIHVSKRSMTRELGSPLLGGMEKISKRSVNNEEEDEDETPLRETRSVFLPGFSRRRQGRSAPKFETDILDGNDVFKRQRRQVFLTNRIRRSVDPEEDDNALNRAKRQVFLTHKIRHVRSADSEDDALNREKRQVFLTNRIRQVRSVDSEDDALNRAKRQVFLTNRLRQVRSVDSEDDEALNRPRRQVFLTNKIRRVRSVSSDDDMEEDTNREKRAVVFLPSFNKRQKRETADEDMETAETSVFMPAFSWRERGRY